MAVSDYIESAKRRDKGGTDIKEDEKKDEKKDAKKDEKKDAKAA